MVYEKQKPDLIILDLILPGISCEELLPMLNNTPVTVLSAKDNVNDKISVLHDGATDYITKPFLSIAKQLTEKLNGEI